MHFPMFSGSGIGPSSTIQLTLFSTASWPTYSARGGDIYPPQGFLILGPKNQDLRSKQGTTLKYRQLLTSIKKIGVNSPKIEPTRSKSKFPRKRRKSRFCQNCSFSGILTSATKTALTRSFLAQFTSFLLHMRTDSLFQVLGEETRTGINVLCQKIEVKVKKSRF